MDNSLAEELIEISAIRGQYADQFPSWMEAVNQLLRRVSQMNNALVTGNWPALRSHVNRAESTSKQLFSEMKEESASRQGIVSRVRALAEPLQETFDSLPAGPELDQLIDELIAFAEVTNSDLPPDLKALVVTAAADREPHIRDFLTNYSIGGDSRLHQITYYALILGQFRAVWLRHLDQVNISINSTLTIDRGTRFFNDEVFETISNNAKNVRLRLQESQLLIKNASTTEQLLEATTFLRADTLSALPTLAHNQGALYVAGQALRRLGKGQKSEDVGAGAATLGLLIRECLASYTAAYRIACSIDLGIADEPVEALLASAAHKSFEATGLPDGKNTQLGKLNAVSDGTLVEVGGYVRAIQAIRMDAGRKLVGSIHLKDPSSGAIAEVLALFVHPRHVGITGGSYLIATGKFRTNSVLASGRPAVEVSSIGTVSLADTDWRMEFLNLSRPWFVVWRNGKHMHWSVGRHRPNSLTDRPRPEGASEPLFTPFLRGV